MFVPLPGSSTIAVLDACVLYPAALRDTLLRAAEARLYRPRWSKDILDEVRRSLVATRRQSEAQAEDLIVEMRRGFPGSLVEGYERLIDAMTNDPKDRHVSAAAVAGGARLIVTSNLRHFPTEALDAYGVRAVSPDEFLSNLFDDEPEVVKNILRNQAVDLQNPPMTVADVMTELRRHAPGFVTKILLEPL